MLFRVFAGESCDVALINTILALELSDLFGAVISIHHRHIDVHEDKFDLFAVLGILLKAFDSVAGLQDLKVSHHTSPDPLDQHHGYAHHEFGVIDYQEHGIDQGLNRILDRTTFHQIFSKEGRCIVG